MYNLNVNVSSSNANTNNSSVSAINNLLAVENAANTPRTPEILNTLIALTNPLDNYDFTTDTRKSLHKSSTYNPSLANNDSSNSSGSQTESPTSQASVQHTCSQLIKAGLKLSIQSKRKFSGDSGGGGSGYGVINGGGDLLDLDANNAKKRKMGGSIKGEVTGSEDEYDSTMISPQQGLTPEDEERRRRRRERNKIAATKCRLKKREKTVNLVHESETLETQNIELKTQIQQLETQRRRLTDMLTLHGPACVKNRNNNNNNGTPSGQSHQHYDTNSNDYLQHTGYDPQHSDDCINSTVATIITSIPSITTLSTSNLDTITTYTPRPSSIDIPLSYSHHLDYGTDQYADTKPVIIVNEPGDNYTTQQLTDLDSPNSPYQYSHCHNYETNTGQSSQGYNNSGLDNGCMA